MLILTLALAASSPASATLAVLPVGVSEAGTSVDRALLSALTDVADGRHGLDPLPEEALFALSVDAAEPLAACGSDRPCLLGHLRRMDVDWGLVVLVNRLLDPPMLVVSLLEVRTGRVFERSGPTEELQARSREWAEAVFEEAGLRMSAEVTLSITPSAARVYLDGRRTTGGPHRVAPGAHVVEVQAEGHGGRRLEIELAPAERRAIDVRLEAETSVVSSPWLWIGVAAAAIGAAVAIGVVAGQGGNDCLCLSRPDLPCPDQC